MGKRENDSKSSPVILTFREYPPTTVYIGFQRYKTKIFIPNPTRCYKCQRYGHTAGSCRAKLRCPRCSLEHEFKDCPLNAVENASNASNLKCPNCGGNHSAAFKGCSAFIKAKEINIVKVSNKISYAEAVKKFQSENISRTRASVNTVEGSAAVHQNMENTKVKLPSQTVNAAFTSTPLSVNFPISNNHTTCVPSSDSVTQLTNQSETLSSLFTLLLKIIQSPNLPSFCEALQKFISDYLGNIAVDNSININGR